MRSKSGPGLHGALDLGRRERLTNGAIQQRRELLVSSSDTLDRPPRGVVAACLLTDHRTDVGAIYSTLLAWAIPVVRIDPFIRHAREHLPFDVVLPATSEPRRLISALRQLMPQGRHPS